MTRPTRLRARAVLFVALNGAAVPACQHIDGETSQKRAALATVARGVEAARVAAPHDPRLPPPPRLRT